jgi:fibronectin type 3 domain-containing protein
MKKTIGLLTFTALMLLGVVCIWRSRSVQKPTSDHRVGPSAAQAVEKIRPLQRVLLSSEAPVVAARPMTPKPARPELPVAQGDDLPVDPFGAPYDDDVLLERVVRPAPRDLPPGARESLIAILEDEIREKGGVFGYNSRRYGATLDSNSIEFATTHRFRKIGSPTLGYALEHVTVGEDVVARGGPAAPKVEPESRTVVYSRGTIDETYTLRPEALEQTIIVRELPQDRGAITVSGRITTNLEPPADGSHGDTISFSHRGVEVISLSEAVAIDAAGRRRPLELAYDQGRLSMTVPADWVATATLPIRIDPLVGPAFTVVSSTWGNGNTNYNVDYFTVRTCDAAYSALNQTWFVVWTEKFGASTWDYDVRGQRITATGTLAGGIVGIVTTGAGSYEPTIAVGRTTNAQSQPWDRYLITWRHDPTADGLVNDQNIWGKVYDQDGVFFTLSPFAISNTSGQDLAPSAAYDGTRFYVSWTNRISSSRYDVRGQFVTATGTIPNINQTYDPAIVTNIAGGSSVAYANGVYLVAWEEGTGSTRSVRARTMNPNGTFPSPAVEVEPSANTPREPDVANGGTQFLVAWRRTSNNDINARLVNATTANPLTFSGASFNVATGNTARQTPRAAYSPTDDAWLVVYRDGATGGGDVYGAKVSSAGVASAPVAISTAAVDEWRPELAWNSVTNEFLVVYRKDPATALLLMGQRFSLSSPPVAPTNLVGTPGDAQASLSWAASSGATSYNLKRGTTSGGPYSNVQTGITSTSAVDSPLTNGTAYYYVVTAVNANGESGFSNQVAVTPQVPAPAAPTNLVAVAGNAQVSLTWNAASGAASYAVQRGTASGGPYSVVNPSVAGTSYVDLNLVNGTTYYFVVTASNAGGESPVSNEATATPSALPTPPSNLSAISTDSWISLTWSAGTNASSYIVKRALSASGPFVVIASGIQGTGYLDGNVVLGETYFYVVVSANGAGESTASAPASTTATQGAPVVPAGVSAAGGCEISAPTLGLVGLHWDFTGGTGAYNVKRSTTAGGPYTTLAIRHPHHVYTDRSLTLGRTYYYVVTSVNSLGESGASEEVSATPQYPVEKPSGIPVIDDFTFQNWAGKLRLFWSPSQGASTYQVWRSLSSEDHFQTLVFSSGSPNELWAIDEGVTPGTEYFYVVRGINPAGNGPEASEELPPKSVIASTDPPMRKAPTLYSLSSVDGIVTFAWSPGLENTGYKIKIGGSPTGPWNDAGGHYLDGQSLTDAGHLMWLDSIVSNSFFAVASTESGVEGPLSAALPLTLAFTSAPPAAAPGNVQASGGNGVVAVSWNPTPQTVNYQIVRIIAGQSPIVMGTTYATVFVDNTVSNGQEYNYIIKALNPWGESAGSAPASATPMAPPAPPGVPILQAATANSPFIDLLWTPIGGATGYVIKRANNSGGPYVRIGSKLAPNIDFRDSPASGATYYYVVSAVGVGGESANSNEMSATLQ